jgi:P-type E1-E2 ATPase
MPQTLSTDELVVGDIMTIASGDAIDVDLLVVEGNFVEVDESSVTGVSGNKIKSSSSSEVTYII